MPPDAMAIDSKDGPTHGQDIEANEREGAVTLGAIRNLLKEELSSVKDSVKQISQDLGIFKIKMNSELQSMGRRKANRP